ncbi:MAG: type 1 glutamine amidotransferase [Mariprofundales bacterium]
MSMKPLLVIQQVAHEPAALIDAIIIQAGLTRVTLLVEEDNIPVEAEDYCAIIIMGGPASANDNSSVIKQQQRLIAWCLDHHTPLLGICLGAQLIAKTAGGAIMPAAVRELGWYPLSPTAAAADDPLFCHLTDVRSVFQWHGETFSLPEAATRLASCSQVPNQAFRLGAAQYGMQFHIEIDPALVECWIAHGDDERVHLGNGGVVNIQQDTIIHASNANAFCRQMISSWIALL